MGVSDRNLKNTWQFVSVPMTYTSSIEDNLTYLITGIQGSSTVALPSKTGIISKDDSSATNNYWRKQDASVILDI